MRVNKGKLSLALAAAGAVIFGLAAAGLAGAVPGIVAYAFTHRDYVRYDLARLPAATALIQKIAIGNVNATDILARGRPGSPWDTPAGEYSVLTKEENHYSSFGNVNMPWSLQFFGNFFIHGWPTYPNGAPVPTGFSGGCVRLSTTAAKQVYAFADLGTPVSVYGPSTTTPGYAPHFANQSFYLLNQPPPLKLSTSAYLVADLETGEIIAQDQMNKVLPIASLTKLMTALVSLEVLNQEKVVTVSKTAAAMPPTSGHLQAGERIKTTDLLYPLLLVSGNDAAEQLAEVYGKDNFIKTIQVAIFSVPFADLSAGQAGGASRQIVVSLLQSNDRQGDLTKIVNYLKRYIFYGDAQNLPAKKEGLNNG